MMLPLEYGRTDRVFSPGEAASAERASHQENEGGATLRSLIHHAVATDHDSTLETVQRIFADHDVDFLALTREGMVTGVCSRLQVGKLLGSRFGFALYSRQPAHSAQVDYPLVFREGTPARNVLEAAFSRRGDDFQEDVVLVDEAHRLVGLIPIDALARLQSRLVADQLCELQRQHGELDRTVAALRQSRSLCSGLFESHTLGVALLSRDGRVEEHNRRLAELLNFGPAGREFSTLAAWVVDTERPAFLALLDQHARGGSEPVRREFSLRVPDRGVRVFRCSTGWIPESGQICACFDDITEQRTLEQAMLRQEKQLLLDTLVGGIAHELNNKLTPVRGFAELILQAGAAERAEYVKLMDRSVAEAAAIIRQLLQLAKPATPTLQTVDLGEVARTSLAMLRFQFRAARCELDLLAGAAPVWVHADPGELKQVAINLLINALHAVADRTHPSVRIEVLGQGGEALLRVSDNGVGIPAEIQGRIFDPFFTTKGPDQGSGLGLSVCFSIVRRHGGTISVTSEPAQGAVFTVRMPTAVPPAVPVASFLEATPTRERRTERTVSRVLVVEDEPDVRRLVWEIIRQRFGCEADLAANAIDALALLRKTRYDLILSDIRMPKMDGTELYLWLRETQPMSASRFMFLTGNPDPNALPLEVRRIGVPILAKPFTSDDLEAACSRFLLDRPAN